MKDPDFLTLAEAIDIHQSQIELFGGSQGIRDMGLLQSAIAQPAASFGGHWLHPDIFAMASAYVYHICQNHSFLDGNKRTALACALVFLEMNGIEIRDPKSKLYEAMMAVAESKMSKEQLAELFKELSI